MAKAVEGLVDSGICFSCSCSHVAVRLTNYFPVVGNLMMEVAWTAFQLMRRALESACLEHRRSSCPLQLWVYWPHVLNVRTVLRWFVTQTRWYLLEDVLGVAPTTLVSYASGAYCLSLFQRRNSQFQTLRCLQITVEIRSDSIGTLLGNLARYHLTGNLC